jgi:hypothetical protein
MHIEKIQFGDYLIEYYLKIGINKSLTQKVYKQLKFINKDSGNNLKYGIFKPKITDEEIKNFFNNTIIALIYDKNGDLCGFFYNYIIDYDPLFIHQGLVLIYKNHGNDLITIPYMYSNTILYRYFKKEFFLSNISTVPKIVGIFTDIFENVWPSHRSENVERPPKEYIALGEKLFNSYIKPFFPEGVFFNSRRFVLTSPLKEIGFETNIRELPRYKDLQVNLFLHFWIDLTKGEDIIQIGQMKEKTYKSFKKIIDKTDLTKFE